MMYARLALLLLLLLLLRLLRVVQQKCAGNEHE